MLFHHSMSLKSAHPSRIGVSETLAAATPVQVELQPDWEKCDNAFLGKLKGHDVPPWAQNW